LLNIFSVSLQYSGFPKRPLSGYNWFFKEERKKVLDLDFQSMGREISSRWKKISKDERKRFDELATKDAGRYRTEVQIYHEEQILKARKERALQENNLCAEKRGNVSVTGNYNQVTLGNGSSSLVAVATLRATEEKNHPDAPQRLSPQVLSFAASATIPVSQNLTDVHISRPQYLNLVNEMKAVQHQALLNQLALGTLPQNQKHCFSGQANDAITLQQLQRQNVGYTLALALAQKRIEAELDGQDAFVHEMLWRRQQQQQQQQLQQQQLAPLNTFSGGSNIAYAAGISGALPVRFLPSHLATPTMIHGLSQQLLQQPRLLLQDSVDQVGQGVEATLKSLLRRMGQANPDGDHR
jgi:hypothetical protein